MTSAAPYSLKRRLLAGLMGAVALVWLATTAYSYFDARHEINELLDAHLAQSASLIVAQVTHDLEEIELEHAPASDRHARHVAFQVWEDGTGLRLRSGDAPSSRLSPREEGFDNTRLQGRSWRVFTTWDAGHRYLVQIAERDEARREIAGGIATNLLVPLVVALPVLALFAWITIGRAVKPLDRLGDEVERRSADNLHTLALEGAPREVIPLVRSLNALFDRVQRLVENERRFTADAAHEMRTPLAGLKTQAQVARGAADEGARQHALDRVIEGCDRATRLVDQLLTLARLEPGGARPGGSCDLVAIARPVVAELAPFALARGVEVELIAPAAVGADGHADLLSILLRNLVDNAVRYSPGGGRVRVEIARIAAAARLTVSDQGRGIGPEDRARIGQRFYRVLGTGQTGSGLGLSIVQRIAEIHGARLRFEDGDHGKGLRVIVELPDRRTA
ncbi:MAG TPA: ATP-binding protein [Usitatibacter sp.]|nr:ATP-binding protein [Usitatibacter sp.]